MRDMITADPTDTQTHIFAGWTRNPDTRFHPDLLPKPSARRLSSEAALFAKRIRALNPDLIEVHSNLKTAAGIARTLPDIPVVFYRHSYGVSFSLFKNLRQSFRYSWIAHIISVSHFVHRTSIEVRPKTISRSSVLHNTLLAEPWLCEEHDKDNIILFCGRAIQEKGIEPFIQAVGDILPHFPDWRVVVLNALTRDENLASQDYDQQQAALFKKTFGDKGKWLTDVPRAQIQAWMKKARIAIAPSIWNEPFCVALLEMHLAGCAVISSGRGGMKEVSG